MTRASAIVGTSLLHTSEVQAPQKEQMVTVWPVETDRGADRVNAMPRHTSCGDAVRYYGLRTALDAFTDAGRSHVTLNGLGPFLLAWSPSQFKGRPDALVLVSNLTNVTTEDQAREIFSQWSLDIEQNPKLWAKGWNLQKLKIVIRLWADKYGPRILKVFGSKE